MTDTSEKTMEAFVEVFEEIPVVKGFFEKYRGKLEEMAEVTLYKFCTLNSIFSEKKFRNNFLSIWNTTDSDKYNALNHGFTLFQQNCEDYEMNEAQKTQSAQLEQEFKEWFNEETMSQFVEIFERIPGVKESFEEGEQLPEVSPSEDTRTKFMALNISLGEIGEQPRKFLSVGKYISGHSFYNIGRKYYEEEDKKEPPKISIETQQKLTVILKKFGTMGIDEILGHMKDDEEAQNLREQRRSVLVTSSEYVTATDNFEQSADNLDLTIDQLDGLGSALPEREQEQGDEDEPDTFWKSLGGYLLNLSKELKETSGLATEGAEKLATLKEEFTESLAELATSLEDHKTKLQRDLDEKVSSKQGIDPQQMGQFNDKIASINSSIETINDTIASTQTEHARLLSSLRTDVNEAKTQLQAQKDAVDSASELTAKKEDLEAQENRLADKIAAAGETQQQDKQEIQTSIAALDTQIKEAQQELESQKSDNREFQKSQLNLLQRYREQLLDQLKKRQDQFVGEFGYKLGRVETDSGMLKDNVGKLQRQTTDLTRKSDAFLRRATSLETKQGTLDTSVQQIGEKTATLEGKTTDLEGKTAGLETQITGLERNINVVNTKLDNSIGRLDILIGKNEREMEARVKKLEADLNKQIEELKDGQERLTKESIDKDTNIKELVRVQQASTEKMIETLRGQIDKLKKDRSNIKLRSGQNTTTNNPNSHPGSKVHFTAKRGGGVPRFYKQGGGGDSLSINFDDGISIDFLKKENYSGLIKYYLMMDKNQLIEDSSNEISEETIKYLTDDIELRYGPGEKLLYKRKSCEKKYKEYDTAGGSNKGFILPLECYLDLGVKEQIDSITATSPVKILFKCSIIEGESFDITIDSVNLDQMKDIKTLYDINAGAIDQIKGSMEGILNAAEHEANVLVTTYIARTRKTVNDLKGIDISKEQASMTTILSNIAGLERDLVVLNKQIEDIKTIMQNTAMASSKNRGERRRLEGEINTKQTEIDDLRQQLENIKKNIEDKKKYDLYSEEVEKYTVKFNSVEQFMENFTNALKINQLVTGILDKNRGDAEASFRTRAGLNYNDHGNSKTDEAQELLEEKLQIYQNALNEIYPIISYFQMGDISYFYINKKSEIFKFFQIELADNQDLAGIFFKDEIIEEDVVHCYREPGFDKFQSKFNEERLTKGYNIYDVDFELAQKDKPDDSDEEKLFIYLRDELFYKTYSTELRTYLKSDGEKLIDTDWINDLTGKFYDIDDFEKNYGSQEGGYYNLQGYNSFRTYSEFIKKVVDDFTEKIGWLNNQIKISNESGKNTMECVYGTADKLGMERGKIDQAIGNEEEFKKVIDELNEYRKTIGLLPFTKIDETTTTPSDEGGDEAAGQPGQPGQTGEPGDEELDQISIKNLNGLLTYAKGILNNSKTSESSKELMTVSREIQNFTNDSEFNKFLIKSVQSLANRRPAEPVNEDELPEDSPILVEQKNRTLYLKILGINVDKQSIKIENVPNVDPTDTINLATNFSGQLKSSKYKFFINDKELVISLEGGNVEDYKVGMNVIFNETIDIGKITKINEDGKGYNKYNSGNTGTICGNHFGGVGGHLVIDVGPGISKLMEQVLDCKEGGPKPFMGFTASNSNHPLNIKLSDSQVEPEQPNYYSLVFNSSGLQGYVFKFSMDSSFDLYKSSPKPSYGPVLDEEKKELYENLLTKIFMKGFNLDWTDTFTLEGMKYLVDSDNESPAINLSLVAGGSLRTVIPKLKDIEKTIQSMDKSIYRGFGKNEKIRKKTPYMDRRKESFDIVGVPIEGIIVSTRDEKFTHGSIGIENRKIVPGAKMKILKKGILGAAALGLAGPGGLALYGAKQVYDSKSQKTTADPTKAFKTLQSGGADSSWTGSVVTSKEKRSLERLKKSLDYNFNSETENNKDLKEEVAINNSLKYEIKEDILEIIGEVEDNPVPSEPKEKKDKKTKEMEDKLLKLIEEQNKSKSASANADLTRQISALKGQLSQQRSQQPRTQILKPGQQTLKPGQQTLKPGQPVKPGQQPIKPGQQPVKPGQPGQPPPAVQGEQGKTGPSLLDRLFGSSSSEKEQLDRERQDFERDKENELKEKNMRERMEELKKEETIQTDLFKQLPDKSSPEYERVKKLMIEQIKLIHKYNLLKQETFQLMLENSKCEDLIEENREQKKQIKDLENKIFSIIQQILGSKTSNRGLNKLNRDLLSYIDDLKSTNPDGSLVDTEKYLDLIHSFKSTSRKKTLKKVQKKKSTNKTSDKDENKKKTPNKLRKKFSPKKNIQKRTPSKPKPTKEKKVQKTPGKSKPTKERNAKNTPTKPKMTKVYKGKRTPVK